MSVLKVKVLLFFFTVNLLNRNLETYSVCFTFTSKQLPFNVSLSTKAPERKKMKMRMRPRREGIKEKQGTDTEAHRHGGREKGTRESSDCLPLPRPNSWTVTRQRPLHGRTKLEMDEEKDKEAGR